jgi:hypothetical protein
MYNMFFKSVTYFILVVLLTSLLPQELLAKKRRTKVSKDRRKEQAINVIRTQSEEVAKLAGLDPVKSDSLSTDSLYADIAEMLNSSEIDSLSCRYPDAEDSEEGDLGEDPAELEAEDDVQVEIDDIKMLWLTFVEDEDDKMLTNSGIRKNVLMENIMDWLGTPYRFGGQSNRAIDCSAFTQRMFLETCDIELPRTARTQIKVGTHVDRRNLQFGDLIFFNTYSRRFASHVGIYLGDNLFAHASSRYGVTVTSLESTYYKKRFIEGRRIGVRDLIKYSVNDTVKFGKK